ncbi:TraR/DksA family transcriptional regulator [Hydrogenophaga sp.]|uniref:TraR/DksA family transcriptional regulator n=1 Tax=Hydrogenophaga sp. TaxID=1904254 RepID=UPI003F70B091
MNATRHSLYQQLFALLQQREVELRAILETDDARALHSATGDTEVTDFKEIAAHGVAAAVEDMQAAHAAAELSQVIAAQRRLDDGTYGFCAACGEPIAEQRLLVMPQAPYCMACQSYRESSDERHGPASRT